MDKRSVKDIAWCAATYSMNRLYWIDGYLLCSEVYEKSFEHEITNKEFLISQFCFGEFPEYTKIYEIDKSLQIPIARAKIFKSILAQS